jgi:hypothetical protein
VVGTFATLGHALGVARARSPLALRRLIPLLFVVAGCSRLDVELLDGAIDAPRVLITCQGHVCACVNGIDDDGDGRADGLDDACTAARDDDEAGFGMGPARPPECLDCFFDANEGSGDDQCRVAASCRDSGSPGAMGACPTCDVDAACVANCRPLVPNGCDCFGCCAIEGDGVTRQVVLAEGCTAASLADPVLCPPCVQHMGCVNPCERCERCPGREVLPVDCEPTCGDGETPCASGGECALGQACVLGCCIVAG